MVWKNTFEKLKVWYVSYQIYTMFRNERRNHVLAGLPNKSLIRKEVSVLGELNPWRAMENSRADDNLFLFFIFKRKSCWTLHVNRLPSRRFTCNDKHYFLWKIQKNILWKCRLPIVIGTLRVNTGIYCVITLTSLCYEHPENTLFLRGKEGFTGVYIGFLNLAQIYRLWVLVRLASLRLF